MDHFTIRDIENLSGIKAHTLRIWEQRYNLSIAKRKQSQHRVYDSEGLKELLLISFLYHNGHKISSIANLSRAEIGQLVESSIVRDDNYEVFVQQLVAAGVDFDKEKFEKVVNCLVMRVGLEKCIIHVFIPFLQRIGLLWMTNNVIPAQEHFVSHIIRKKIILATDGVELNENNRSTILVYTPKDEYHEIPLLTANYFFRKYGNRTVYFGLNVSIDSLRTYLEQHKVTHLYTHVITHFNHEWLEQYIYSLCEEFPGIKIVVSGPALCKCIQKIPENIQVLHTVEEMIRFAKEVGQII